VRELVIVIPDLYLGESPKRDTVAPSWAPRAAREAALAAGGGVTLPGIEHVARFGSRSRLEAGWRPWLAHWMGRGDLARETSASVAAARAGVTSPAAAVLDAPSAHAPAANTVWIASPLHLQAGLTTLHVDRRSLLRLAPGELQLLCSDFGRVFGDVGLRLEPLPSGEALLSSPPTPEVRTAEPARFVDGDVAGALPEGPGSGYLRRLGAEIEMWLHEHPVNQARLARRDLPVSTLWLWGNDSVATAATPGEGQAREADAFGADAYLQGLCRLLGIECHPLPDSLDAVAGAGGRGPGAARTVTRGSTVIVVTVGELWRERGTFLDALNELDRRFIEPAGRAVRAGSYRQVSVLANDRLTVLTERDHLRLWRRPRPGLEALRWT